MKFLVSIFIFGIFSVQGFNHRTKSNFLNVLLPNVECRGGGDRFGPPSGQVPQGPFGSSQQYLQRPYGQYPQEYRRQFPQGNQPIFNPTQGELPPTQQQYGQRTSYG